MVADWTCEHDVSSRLLEGCRLRLHSFLLAFYGNQGLLAYKKNKSANLIPQDWELFMNFRDLMPATDCKYVKLDVPIKRIVAFGTTQNHAKSKVRRTGTCSLTHAICLHLC